MGKKVESAGTSEIQEKEEEIVDLESKLELLNLEIAVREKELAKTLAERDKIAKAIKSKAVKIKIKVKKD